MGTRKKGSELVFNLQWRNMPDNGGDRSNVVGMYDTPATTQNFETFKSYLLKNSGIPGNDVKVTYLTDNGAEWVIDSQEWFEIALCAFRLKARLGEVIFLKLDRISNHQHMMRKHSNDVETQFGPGSVSYNFDSPPEWFLRYMKQFKRDIIEDVAYAVSAHVISNSKEKESMVFVPHKKVKSDSSKRSRKHMLLGETPIDKELLKTLKFDRKLEIKLDKLDAKTKKIKEKKQALISKLEQTEENQNKNISAPSEYDATSFLDGSAVNETGFIPHMLGGETYLHSWEIMNTGKYPWTSRTELRLTWGSADMKPSSNVIRCPPLKPGEKGTVSVKFEIPEKPGQYESYWNFYERDMRFGHWLSCSVIVSGPFYSMGEKVFLKKPKIEQEQQSQPPTEVAKVTQEPLLHQVEPKEKKIFSSPQFLPEENFVMIQENFADLEVERAAGLANSVIDLSRRMQDVKIVGTSQVDSDSDWESVCAYGCIRKPKSADDDLVVDGETRKSNKYGINEKDLIVDLSTSKEYKSPSSIAEPKISEESKQQEITKQNEENQNSNDDNNNNEESANNVSSGESICEIASEASSDLSSGYDVISAPVCEEKEDSGYVYITIDGNKLPVPKHILRPDFLANAEEAPGPITLEDDDKVKQDNANVPEEPVASAMKLESQIQELEQDIQETKSFMSHCSAAGTCFSDVNSSATPGASRLFIFPQNNPGYEVVCPTASKEEENVTCPTNKADLRSEAVSTYTWSHSDTSYTFGSDMPSGRVAYTVYEPYGPLDQSRPTSSQTNASGQNETFTHIPNYQQSNPKRCSVPPHKPKTPTAPPPPPPDRNSSPPTPTVPQVHLLPENLVSGAVNVASSAINTARSVINMIVPPKPEPGKWVNGHWVTEHLESTRAKNLCILADMGFWDTDLNATLLARYNDDISRVVSELLQ